MSPTLSRQQAGWLGFAVMVGFLLAVTGLFAIGDKQHLWRSPLYLDVRLASAGGIEVGTRVRVQGVSAGQVEALLPPRERGGEIIARLRLDASFQPLIGADAVATVRGEGLIGGKIVDIAPGSPGAPSIGAHGVLQGQVENPLSELNHLSRKGQAVLDDVQGLATRLKDLSERSTRTLEDMQHLVTNVRDGQGILGKELVGTLKELQATSRSIAQGVESLKYLPVFGKYLENSTTKALIRPNSERFVFTFQESELFHPGRAVFTPDGIQRLHRLASEQLPRYNVKGSELVIAAYAETAFDAKAADVLTQEQCELVKVYLMDNHKVHKLGWFTSRPIQTIGMGTRSAPGDPPPSPPPPRRVEVIVFVPPGSVS